MFPTFHQNNNKYLEREGNYPANYNADYERYKTIATCLDKSVSPNLLAKCRVDADNSDRLSLIPVTTDKGMTFKNIYCYACNNNKSTISLKFQPICNTFIEHTLFTNLSRLLNAIQQNCQNISFMPRQNNLCSYQYNITQAAKTVGEKFIRLGFRPSQLLIKSNSFVEVNASEIEKPTRKVFEKCNKTGYYINTESDATQIICESDDVNVMSLPEYRVDNYVYKNFACFLCNPEYASFTFSSDNATSLCKSISQNRETYKVLEEFCNFTEFHPRWYPYKNMYCAECNMPAWYLVSTT
jgi:hypothetical protein